ncbi:MAG: leucine-rich repeat protein [Firmicutes bacterium]|nr:leucine-rich repeat protein [Bacillota bacterium]
MKKLKLLFVLIFAALSVSILFACRLPQFVVTIPSGFSSNIEVFEVFVNGSEEPLTQRHNIVTEGDTITIRYRTAPTFRGEVRLSGTLTQSTFNTETRLREITHIVTYHVEIEIVAHPISQTFTAYFSGEGTNEEPRIHDIGDDITLPSSFRENYWFLGWRIYSVDLDEYAPYNVIENNEDYFDYNNTDDDEDVITSWPPYYTFTNTLPFIAHNVRAEGVLRLVSQWRSAVAPTDITIIGGDRVVPFREDSMNRSYQLTYLLDPNSADYMGLVWESSNPDYISVNDSGLVNIHHAGSAQITVSVLGHLEIYDTILFTATLTNIHTLTLCSSVSGLSLFHSPVEGVAVGEEIGIIFSLHNNFEIGDDFVISIFSYNGEHRNYHGFDATTLNLSEFGGYFTFVMVENAIISFSGIIDNTPPVEAELITINGDSSRVASELGDDIALSFIIYPENANTNWSIVVFSSSDDSIASVNQQGVVSFNSHGIVTITARLYSTLSGTNIFMDEDAVIFDVYQVFLPDSVTIQGGDRELNIITTTHVDLNIVIDPVDRTEGYYTIEWESSNSNIASINITDYHNRVSFHAFGTVVITVRIMRGGTVLAYDSITIRITTAITALAINGYQTQTITVRADAGDMAFNAAAYPIGYAVFPPGAVMLWSSSNPSVVSVTQNGVVSFLAPGTARITVQFPGTPYWAEIWFNVSQYPRGIEIQTPSNTVVRINSSYQLNAEVYGEDPYLPMAAYDISWGTSNPSIATVSNTGLVTFHSVGSVTITASISTVISGVLRDFSHSITFDVRPTANQITITPPIHTTVRENDPAPHARSVTLIYTVNPTNAIGFSVVWTTTNPSVATVENGVVSFHGAGAATIRAQIDDAVLGLTQFAEITFTVTPQPTGVSIDGATERQVSSGSQSVNLMNDIVINPTNADGYLLIFNSSNPSVVSVDRYSGVVTFSNVNYGTAIITVRLYDTMLDILNVFVDSAFVTFRVTAVATGVQIIDGNRDVYRGENTLELQAIVLPIETEGYTFVWESSNPLIATVDAFGVVHFVSHGSVTITVSLLGTNFEASTTVNIRPIQTMPVSITIGFGSVIHREDAPNIQLSISAAPSNPQISATQNIVWTSLNPTVASVGRYTGVVSFGSVTAVTAVVIRATFAFNDTIFDEVTLYVHPAPTNIEIMTSGLIGEGGFIHRRNDSPNMSLSVNVSPLNSIDLDTVWTSSNESIATVSMLDGYGVVSFVSGAYGFVTITVSINGVGNIRISDSVTFRVSAVPTAIRITGEGIVGNYHFIQENQSPLQLTAVVYPVNWASGYDIVWEIEGTGLSLTTTFGASTTVNFSGSASDGHITAIIQIDGLPIGVSTQINFTTVSAPRGVQIFNNYHVIRSDHAPIQLNVGISPFGTTGDLVFSSNAPSVATVNQSGLVSIVGRGTAIITVRLYFNGEFIAQHSATFVVAGIPSSISIDEQPVFNLRDGHTISIERELETTITPEILPEHRHLFTIEWTSSNESVATISSTGLVQIHGIGSTVIRVQVQGFPNLFDEITINIFGQIEGIEIENTVIRERRDLNTPIYVEVDVLMNNLSQTPQHYSLTFVSSDTAVVTVNNQGRVTIVGAGNATIFVSLRDDLTGAYIVADEIVEVTITAPPNIVTINGLTSDERTVLVGDEMFANISVTTTEKYYVYGQTWCAVEERMVYDYILVPFDIWEHNLVVFSLNENIVTIERIDIPELFLFDINFLSQGTVEIRAEAWSLCGNIMYAYAYIIFTVLPTDAAVLIDKNNEISREQYVGSEIDLRGFVSVMIPDINYSLLFTSNNSLIAATDDHNPSIILFNGPGTATITVSLYQVIFDAESMQNIFRGSSTISFTVIQRANTVVISPPATLSRSQYVDETVNLRNHVSALPLNSAAHDFTFSSDNTSVATVNSNTGVVSFVSAGSVTITVRLYHIASNGDRVFRHSETITFTVIQRAATVSIAGAEELPRAQYVDSAVNLRNHLTINPSNHADYALTFSSNAITVATVNSSGVVSFVGSGNVTITIRLYHVPTSGANVFRHQVTITFNVIQRANTFVVGENLSRDVYIYDSVNLRNYIIVLPAGHADYALTFGSNATNIATVNAQGVVNFINLGSATITIRLYHVPTSGANVFRHQVTITFEVSHFDINYAFLIINNQNVITGLTALGQQQTNIVIPESVLGIGSNAFFGAANLTSITIPASVTSIGISAFQSATGILSIVIPESVVNIGFFAFANWTSSQTIYVEGRTSAPLEWSASWFSGSPHIVWRGWYDYFVINNQNIITGLTSSGQQRADLVIPSSVTAIGSGAFFQAEHITSIVMPTSVTSIGTNAFNGTLNLTSIIIPASVTTIEGSAFQNTPNLRTLTFAENSELTNISGLAFAGSGLDFIIIPPSVNTIGIQAFLWWTSSQTIFVAGRTYAPATWHENWAQMSSANIVWLPIAYSHFNINSNQITGLTSLGQTQTSLAIPPSVTSIGSNAFYGETTFTSMLITSSMTSIGNFAFWNATGLTSIHIPSSVTNLGIQAFRGTANLRTVTFGQDIQITSIQTGMFHVPIALTSITIPASVTYIGTHAFFGASSLATVNFEQGSRLTNIGHGAFQSTGLTSITIPQSVTNIGQIAFSRIPSLTSVTIPSSVVNMGLNVFEDWTSSQTIRIQGRSSAPATWNTGWLGNSTANLVWNS